MAWKFDNKLPVSNQIANRIRLDILNGKYSAGAQLPSVRSLACEAGVNPNTVQKALSLLELEGIVESRGTIGRFVSCDTKALEKSLKILQRDFLEQVFAQAKELRITREDIINFFEEGEKRQ